MRRGKELCVPQFSGHPGGCPLYLGTTNYTPYETTLTLRTPASDTIMTFGSCPLCLCTDTQMFILREPLLNLVATGFFTREEPIKGVPVHCTPMGRDMVGEEREATCTWAHTSQHICSGTWPPFSFCSGSRDFCLVGGSSTHCQERVPKGMLTGSPLP